MHISIILNIQQILKLKSTNVMEILQLSMVHIVRKSEWRRPFGGPSHRWEDIKRAEYENVDYILVAQDRSQWQALVNTIPQTFRLHKRQETLKYVSAYWVLKKDSIQ
jgi:hypothetical protein